MLKLFLLSLTEEQIEKQTDAAQIITMATLALLVIAGGILSGFFRDKNREGTRVTAFAAVSIALSFALSFIKFTPVPYGGSVTAASLLPLLLFSFAYGPVKGLLAGLIYGLLQFLQSPYFLTPIQFVLDYLLAFGAIALAGVLRPAFKKDSSALFAGIALAGAVRFLFHFAAGFIFVTHGQVWANLPLVGYGENSAPALYSLIYNLVYLVPDLLIVFIAAIYLAASKNLERILGILKKH